MKNYLILSNDKVYLKKYLVSSAFNDTINIIDAIGKKFQILLFSKISKNKTSFSQKINKKITRLDYQSILSLKKMDDLKIFMISITPFNFINFFIIQFFLGKQSGYLYLRSDGYQEYKKKIGFLGYIVYGIMLSKLSKRLQVITVSNKIFHTNKKLTVNPSELDHDWFVKEKKVTINYPKLLYLGRIKVEKGVYSLLNLLQKSKKNFKISIVGGSKNFKKNSSIKFIKQVSKKKDIIKLYDEHNIFILPSFTEGAPKVILESLARLRPVIIFKEIKHVKLNFKGVFVCNRKSFSLDKKINYILNNYKKIQKEMKKNILPSKKNFQSDLIKILK